MGLKIDMHANLLDHVAFATTQTDKSIEIFSILGFKTQLFHRQVIEKFDSLITKLQSADGQIIELVEPCSAQSVVAKLLQGKAATIYHSAFLCDDLESTLQQLKQAGAVVVTEAMTIPYPVSEAHKHYKTSHVYHPNVGLFEVTGPVKEKK